MRYLLLEREDFYTETEYRDYIERLRKYDSVSYGYSFNTTIGEAIDEYRNDKESY